MDAKEAIEVLQDWLANHAGQFIEERYWELVEALRRLESTINDE